MEYKGSFIKTILLLFFVLAIVTVIQGRPAGSSKEVLQRDDVKDGDEVPADQSYTTEGTAKKVEQLDDNVEVLQRDDGKDGDEHRHARCQNCHVIHGMPSVSHEGGCKKCHFVHLRPFVIHGMPSVSPEEMLQRDVVNDGDGGCKKCHFVHLRPLVYCKKCLETAPEIAKMLQRDVVNDGDAIHGKPSVSPKATQVTDFEVGQLDDNVEHLHQSRCEIIEDCGFYINLLCCCDYSCCCPNKT